MKHSTWALLVLLFVTGAAIGFRFGLGGDEDTWICRDSVWVAHGKPSAPKPTEPCSGGVVTPTPTAGARACTMEARQCPDGSYVGRSGPNCEFAMCPGELKVMLYYYDIARDKDATGNVLCTDKGLVPVSRNLSRTVTPLRDTMRELLKGDLTQAERDAGISTEYPLAGVSLVSATLSGGVATLTFADPQNRTGGGSCRVGILRGQIERTAQQFEGVKSVVIKPDSLFQP